MKKYILRSLSSAKRKELLKRAAITGIEVKSAVQNIVDDVKKEGLKSAIKYGRKFDGFASDNIYVTEKEFQAVDLLPAETKAAIKAAYKNIYAFHKKQYPKGYQLETISGVRCERRFVSIENVGLYIPSGTAPLPSTMLMLGVPAWIAGCKRIVAASPSKGEINPAILYAAKLCGISEFIKLGGAQGIALLAYGDNNFTKVNKIFGPGNQYVQAAKGIVSTDVEGCAIDMIAGPSELLIIADDKANPDFLAADLLSQAEHGKDSAVVLVTTDELLAAKVDAALTEQTKKLPRKDLIKKSLKNSFCLVVDNLEEAFQFSNSFAPEHLILNLQKPEKYMDKVINAGSVFLGQYTPESAGDYASGTNHSLPTYGFARSTGGVNVEMFMKGITFQSISQDGLKKLSKTIIELAETESLRAHAEAVRIRIK